MSAPGGLQPGAGYPGARKEMLELTDRLVTLEQWLTKRPAAAEAEAQIVVATEAVLAAFRALRSLHDEKKGAGK